MPSQSTAQPKTYRRPPTGGSSHPKQEEERLTIQVVNYVKKTYPHVIIIHDIAAGMNLKDSDRMKMMATRSEDGQPDISIDFPSRGYHGLRLELKVEGTVIKKKDGTLRKQTYTRKYRKNGKIFIKRGDHLLEQAQTLRKYNRLGYYANFAIGFYGQLGAKKIIDWYMKNENASLF